MTTIDYLLTLSATIGGVIFTKEYGAIRIFIVKVFSKSKSNMTSKPTSDIKLLEKKLSDTFISIFSITFFIASLSYYIFTLKLGYYQEDELHTELLIRINLAIWLLMIIKSWYELGKINGIVNCSYRLAIKKMYHHWFRSKHT